MNYRAYLRRWILAIGVFIILVLSSTIFIDPYGLWGSPRIEGVNAFKVSAASKVGMIKPVQFERIKPRTVVVGNSRPEVGIDPGSPCWNSEDHPVYNYAIPGAGVSAQLAIAMLALEADETRLVVLGIDFVDFLSRPNGAGSKGSRSVPPVNGTLSSVFGTFGDRLTSVLSLDALADSLFTVLGQRRQYPADITESGFNNGNIFASVVANEGQGVLFNQKLAELEARYAPGAWSFDPDAKETEDVLNRLEAALSYARGRDVEIILFTNPLHADFLDFLRDRGFEDDISAWLKILNEIAQRQDVAFWHFATAHEYASQEIPASTDRTLSRWFWEPSHYRAVLGDLLLARIRGTCPDARVDPVFGVKMYRP